MARTTKQPQSLADMVNPKKPTDGAKTKAPAAKRPAATKTAAQPAPARAATPAAVQPKKASRARKPGVPKKLILIVVLFFIIGGIGAVVVSSLRKSPEQLWASALSNTATGLERFTAIDTSDRTTVSLDGSFALTSPLAVDGSSSGLFDGQTNSGQLKFDIGTSGVRVNAEVLLTPSAGQSPDVYFKVSGLEGAASLLSTLQGEDLINAASLLGQVNDQWYFVDHTILDQALLELGADTSTTTRTLTEAETQEVTNNLLRVMRDRLFSSGSDGSVFSIMEEIGKEDFEGINSYKFKAGVNKENLKAFLVALKDSVKGTAYETLLLESQPNNATIEEALSIDQALEVIDGYDLESAYADVWVEANGGFVRNIRLYPVAEQKDTNYLDLLLNYEGGDVFPFLIRATIEDAGQKSVISAGMNVNARNGNIGLTLDFTLDSPGQPAVSGNAKLDITNVSESYTAQVPDDAKSYLELVEAFNAVSGTPIGGTTQGAFSDNDPPVLNPEDFLNDFRL